MTAPRSKIINVFESLKQRTEVGGGVEEIDLATPFRLDRISIQFYRILPKSTYTSEGVKGWVGGGGGQVCYVLGGSAILSVGPSPPSSTATGLVDTEGDVAGRALEGIRIEDITVASGDAVNENDCFSLSATERWQLSTKGTLGSCSILVISDVPGAAGANDTSKETESKTSTTLPKIVYAPEAGKWFTSTRRKVQGIEHVYITRLVDSTDLGTPIDANAKEGKESKNQINNRWGFNRERLPPGCQTSYAHSHSHEDEFVIILSGNARYWHHGETPERILKRGDCIGWKAGPEGDAIAHSLLNDALDENGAGEELVMLVWGEDKPDEDRVWYGRADVGGCQPWWKPEDGWEGAKKYPLLGDASHVPKFPRPDDRPFPE